MEMFGKPFSKTVITVIVMAGSAKKTGQSQSLFSQEILGGQVCYLPNEQDCFLKKRVMIGILAAGQVTNLPSQHFLLAYLTHRIKLCIGIYKTIPRARGNYELHFLTEKDGFVNRFLQVSAARFLVFGEKSSTFALVNETMNLVLDDNRE